MTILKREPNAKKPTPDFLGNSLGRSQEVCAIEKSYKGYPIETFVSLVNKRWQAWATLPDGANLLMVGHDTQDDAKKATWEQAKRKIAERLSKDILRSGLVRLRDHPLMSYRGVPTWPPTWTQNDAYRIDARRKLRGEIGILKHVIEHDALPNKGFLVIEHEGERWMGCLLIEDRMFCEQTCDLLKTHLDRSIKEIGDMDLIFTM